MVGNIIFIRFQALVAAGIVSMFAVVSLPALSQDTEGEGESNLIESTITGDVDPSQAVTVEDLTIPIDQLELLIKPLTVEELQVEAAAWLLLLKNKVQEISTTEIAIKAEKEATEKGEDKEQLLVNVTKLQGQLTAIIDRFNVVLDALENKGGDTASYRKYIEAVSGIKLDVTDREGLGIRVVSWLKSEEGGQRLAINLAKVLSILLVSVILSQILGKLVDRLLNRVGGISTLFRGFIVMIVRRGVLVVGVFLALATLGVNLGPILALVGGLSFILAFALQSNLGNFASGLMLLINKPFDVGDEVKVAGYWAYVDSISLASTKLKEFSGSMVTLPNNTVWGSDIINLTHSDTRSLSFPIHVKFEQDLDQVISMWTELALSHPKVLEKPAPSAFCWNSHYDYYIYVGLKAWTATDGYWGVYSDLLKSLQKRLLELGIELAIPQQDIRVHQSQSDDILAKQGEF